MKFEQQDRAPDITDPIILHFANGSARKILQELKKAISQFTIEAMDCGGTLPWDTCWALELEYPDIYKRFDKQKIKTLCEQIQKSEIPEESERLQQLFETFNERYFGRRLSTYEIKVVYDVNYWSNEYFFNGVFVEEFSYGYIDVPGKKIFLRISYDIGMEGALLHEMAHAATNEDHGDEWEKEMLRLQAAEAPVLESDFRPYVPCEKDSPQLRLDLFKVLTAEQVFSRTPIDSLEL